MPNIELPRENAIPDASRPVLERVRSRLGFVPNVIKLMARSPAVLNGFAGLQQSLGGQLDRRTREAIALVVSEVNGCTYCLAAHTHTSVQNKAPLEEIARNRAGQSSDAAVGAAARFAGRLVESRGHVTADDLADVRAAGYSDPQILDIVALSVQFLFTNFMNTVAGTEIDFPEFDGAGPAAVGK